METWPMKISHLGMIKGYLKKVNVKYYLWNCCHVSISDSYFHPSLFHSQMYCGKVYLSICLLFYFRKGLCFITMLAYRTQDPDGSRSLKPNIVRRMKTMVIGRSLEEGSVSWKWIKVLIKSYLVARGLKPSWLLTWGKARDLNFWAALYRNGD